MTVEGLSRDGKLDPLQEAFIAHDAPQCGFCTSGQLMSATRRCSRRTRSRRAAEVRAGARRQPLPLFELQPHRRSGRGDRRLGRRADARQEVPQ